MADNRIHAHPEVQVHLAYCMAYRDIQKSTLTNDSKVGTMVVDCPSIHSTATKRPFYEEPTQRNVVSCFLVALGSTRH